MLFPIHIIFLLGFSPLVSGLLKKIKALMQSRQGPPLLQSYFDLAKWLRKGVVLGEPETWLFVIAPAVQWALILSAALFVPMICTRAPLGWAGDLFMVIGLLVGGKIFATLAALETASAFGGMGASRELTFSGLAEPGLVMALLTAAAAAHSTNFEMIVSSFSSSLLSQLAPAYILALVSFMIILLVENTRLPIDDPATHLELTMIHEAMILDQSGPLLALSEWAASMKLFLFFTILVNVFFPLGLTADITLIAIVLFMAKILMAALLLAVSESVLARLKLFNNANWIAAANAMAALGFFSLFFAQ